MIKIVWKIEKSKKGVLKRLIFDHGVDAWQCIEIALINCSHIFLQSYFLILSSDIAHLPKERKCFTNLDYFIPFINMRNFKPKFQTINIWVKRFQLSFAGLDNHLLCVRKGTVYELNFIDLQWMPYNGKARIRIFKN